MSNPFVKDKTQRRRLTSILWHIHCTYTRYGIAHKFEHYKTAGYYAKHGARLMADAFAIWS